MTSRRRIRNLLKTRHEHSFHAKTPNPFFLSLSFLFRISTRPLSSKTNRFNHYLIVFSNHCIVRFNHVIRLPLQVHYHWRYRYPLPHPSFLCLLSTSISLIFSRDTNWSFLGFLVVFGSVKKKFLLCSCRYKFKRCLSCTRTLMFSFVNNRFI